MFTKLVVCLRCVHFVQISIQFFKVLLLHRHAARSQVQSLFASLELSPPTLWLYQSLAISEYLHEHRQWTIAASIERNWKSTSIHSCCASCDRLQLWNQQSFQEFRAIQTDYLKIQNVKFSLYREIKNCLTYLPVQTWNTFESSLAVLRALDCELQFVQFPEKWNGEN